METYVLKQDNSNYLNDICYKKYINKPRSMIHLTMLITTYGKSSL